MPADYNEKDFTNLEKIFESLENEQYSLTNINIILDKIDEVASLRLYDFIDIDVEESIVDKNRINFVFRVTDSKNFM